METLTITTDGPGSYMLTDDIGTELFASNTLAACVAFARMLGYAVEPDYGTAAEYNALMRRAQEVR